MFQSIVKDIQQHCTDLSQPKLECITFFKSIRTILGQLSTSFLFIFFSTLSQPFATNSAQVILVIVRKVWQELVHSLQIRHFLVYFVQHYMTLTILDYFLSLVLHLSASITFNARSISLNVAMEKAKGEIWFTNHRIPINPYSYAPCYFQWPHVTLIHSLDQRSRMEKSILQRRRNKATRFTDRWMES